MAFLKPQSPMTKGSDYFYPLTTSDQVIMDGGYRLNEIVGKTKKSTIILYANGWSAEAPYCYSIAIKGLSDKVNMKMLPHFPEDFEDKQLMKEEIAKISFASRENNILTFECWDEIPAIDLLIDIEIDAMYPIKGASIEMNYSVVGGTEQPTKPTKNMIWVNTDQNITNWVFSKSEPKSLEEGMIWFTTGNNSAVSFFTLTMDGKEFDEVYPISAKQYASGAWVDVIAKSYQGEEWVEWVEWIMYLYNKGNEYTNITGGWIAVAKPFSPTWSDANAGKVAITKGNTSIKATFSYNGTNYASGLLCIADDFDLTGKKYIKARCKISASNQYTYGWLGVFDRNVSTIEDAFVAYAVVNNTEFSEITVPIENANLNGLYAIGIGMRVDGINDVSPEIEYLEVG